VTGSTPSSLRTEQRYLPRFHDPDRTPARRRPHRRSPHAAGFIGEIMTNPEHLAAGDQVLLKQTLARCPQLRATAGHVKSFAAMMS
jgi:hypothetical protein